MSSRIGTVARNIFKWGLIAAAVGVALYGGWVFLGVTGLVGGMTTHVVAMNMSGMLTAATLATKAMFSSAALLPAVSGAAIGAVIGTGKGVIEAQDKCDSPACETSLADKAERMFGKGRGKSEPDYEKLYEQNGIKTRSDNAARVNYSSTQVGR